MKRLLMFVACLALLSLACLQSAIVSDQSTEPTTGESQLTVISEPTESTESVFLENVGDDGGDLSLTPPISLQEDGDLCAVVVADVALHVRQEASERALVLDWLARGDVVHVVDQSDGDWWFIEREGISGYARSVFLKEQECE